MTTQAAKLSKTAGFMAGGTTQREVLAAASASSRRKQLAALIEKGIAEETFIVTVSPGVMEFTSWQSPIIPICIVRGEIKDGELFLLAEAGPGQTCSEDTLCAFEIVARRRVRRNAEVRQAEANQAEGQANN